MIYLHNIEQFNLQRYVRTLVGANPTYVNLFYQGLSGGSEFLTYDAKKLYIAFEFKISTSSPVCAGISVVTFYDQNNVINFYEIDNTILWNGAANQYQGISINVKNLFFSRIVAAVYTNIIFNGIKVTWP